MPERNEVRVYRRTPEGCPGCLWVDKEVWPEEKACARNKNVLVTLLQCCFSVGCLRANLTWTKSWQPTTEQRVWHRTTRPRLQDDG